MIKFKFTEKDTEDYDKWISFYPKRDYQTPFKLKIEKYGYFDPRPQFNFNITSILAVILPFLNLWFLPLSILFLFYGWGSVYMRLPYDTKKSNESENPEYGFNTFTHTGIITEIWFYWGWKRKHMDLPWALRWYRTSLFLKDGNWETEKKGSRKEFWNEKWDKIKFVERHPYSYKLKSGKVQHTIATVTIEEREWRRKWLPFSELFNNVDKSIKIDFDSEIGERSGSWKGGVLGCSYTMLPWETAEETLRRMEKEKKFN